MMQTVTALWLAQSIADLIVSFRDVRYDEEPVNHIVSTHVEPRSVLSQRADRLYLTMDNGAVYELSVVKIKKEEV